MDVVSNSQMKAMQLTVTVVTPEADPDPDPSRSQSPDPDHRARLPTLVHLHARVRQEAAVALLSIVLVPAHAVRLQMSPDSYNLFLVVFSAILFPLLYWLLLGTFCCLFLQTKGFELCDVSRTDDGYGADK